MTTWTDREALLERAKVTAQILRTTAAREANDGRHEDPPDVTWAELNELATLMRESAEVIEALSSSASSETPRFREAESPKEAAKPEPSIEDIAARVANRYLHRYVPHFNIDGHHEREQQCLVTMLREALIEYADALKEKK